MKSVVAICLMFSLAPVAAFAQSEVYGPGVRNCQTWSADRANASSHTDFLIDESWVTGYITGAIGAMGVTSNSHISLSADIDGAFAYINDWCGKNPSAQMQLAAVHFLLEKGTLKAIAATGTFKPDHQLIIQPNH